GCYTLEATEDVTLTLPCAADAKLLVRPSGRPEWTEIAKSSTGSINAMMPLSSFGGKADLRIEN
ncbi:MAG: hypothetical protein NTU88_08335, partial [Armatimonadetes bacterium]|nr:hypothetical protein [Armatimonadota bacterium]